METAKVPASWTEQERSWGTKRKLDPAIPRVLMGPAMMSWTISFLGTALTLQSWLALIRAIRNISAPTAIQRQNPTLQLTD